MIKLENKLLSLIRALKLKLSKELQNYKVKTILKVTRLQDSIWKEGLQDYKSLSKGEGESYLLSGVGT